MASAQASFSPLDCGLVLDQITDAVVVVDCQWRFAYINGAAEKITGMPRDQVLGQVVWELFPKAIGTETYRQCHRAMAEQVPVQYETLSVLFGVWVEVRAFPTPGMLTVVVRDISRRKEAEDALRDSEERFRTTFEQVAIGMVQGKLGGRGLRCNRKFCDMIGYSAAEMENLSFRDITYPEDLPDSQATVGQLIQGTIESAVLRKRYLRRDGAVFWADTTLSLARDAAGKPAYLSAVVEDITDRRLIEQSLRDSERRYRFLTENMKDVVWVLDTQTLRFCYVSPSTQRLSGYTAEEAMAAPATRTLTADATDRLLGLLRSRVDAFASGQEPLDKYYTDEIEQLCKDGSTVWTELITAFQVNAETGHVELRGVTRDISQRKLIEQSLRDNERRYKQLFEAESDAIVLIDNQTGRILEANTAALILYGYQQAELLGKTNSDLSAEPEVTQKVTQDTPVDPDPVVNIPLRFHRKKDGTVFPVEITGRFFNWEGRPVHIAAIRDITDRMRTEDALRRSEERFRQAMDATSDGLWDRNVQTNEVYYSPGYWGMLGYAPHELYGQLQHWLDHVHPDDRQLALADNQDCIENRKTDFEFEFRMRTKDGQWKWILARGKAILRDEQGRAIRMIGTHVDITDRKEAQDVLRQLNEQLELRVRQRTAELAELEAIVNRGPVVVFRRENSPGFPVVFVTENINQFGFRAEDIMARRVGPTQMVHPEDIQRFRMELAQHVRGGVAEFTAHLRFVTPGGDVRWVEDREIAIRNARGIVTHYDGVVLDITEKKLAEERLQESQRHFVALAEHNHRLARELQHRVRNSIQGLIGLVSVLRTRMTDVHVFASAVESRLMALGHVQRMLSDTNWGQVDLCQLVTSTLAAMQSLAPRAAALVVDGPPVLIGPAQVTPLVLILAEWFTNSCKYGAHTSPTGQVTIAWRVTDPSAPSRKMHLSWTETGGPAITAAITPSLGTELVGSFATRELHGRVSLDYPPQGARHSLFFPAP